MIDILLQAARTELIEASVNLAWCRKYGFPEATPIKLLYRALDRVWELQCKATSSNPFAEVSQ